jgi:DnaJ-class molecular chaperone
MPRQREPDAEDMMATCPRCKGSERVYSIEAEAEVDCPLCDGTGRVTRIVYERYVRQ